MSNKTELIEQYCIILKRCLQFYHQKCKNKEESYAHTRRGLTFIEHFPKDAVELTGVKLWKYKSIVKDGDLGNIKHISDKDKINDTPETQKDIANSVVVNVTKTWQSLENEEKYNFTQQIKELLITYTKILSIDKQEKKS